MRLILFQIFISITCISLAQEDPYLLILDSYKNQESILSASDYKLFQDQFNIDTAKQCTPCWYKVWVVQNESLVKAYRFLDSTALILGEAKDSLKSVKIRMNWSMDSNFERATEIADSLRDRGELFFTQPSLKSNLIYMVDISGEIDSTAYPGYGMEQIDSLISIDGMDHWNALYELYPEIPKANIVMMYFGYVRINIFLSEKQFDFERLEKLRLIFDENKLKVKDRYFLFTTVEQTTYNKK
jgi:hypothetical protein